MVALVESAAKRASTEASMVDHDALLAARPTNWLRIGFHRLGIEWGNLDSRIGRDHLERTVPGHSFDTLSWMIGTSIKLGPTFNAGFKRRPWAPGRSWRSCCWRMERQLLPPTRSFMLSTR